MVDFLKRLWDAVFENEKALLRSFILGNAGGAIATLSVIGTVIGSSDDSRFDRGLLWVLVIFLAGLASGTFYRFSELMAVRLKIREITATPEQEPGWATLPDRVVRWEKSFRVAFWVSGVILVVGIVTGLVQLWRLTK